MEKEEVRNYKSGSRYAFWRWTITDTEYIRRLHLIKTPLFAICLHWINHPDPEPHLHDHPLTFLSLILRGGYSELRQTLTELAPRLRVRKWFNFIRASDFDRHRIVDVKPKTLTLCFMGPKTREWGFHTNGQMTRENFENVQPSGWIHWKTYNDKQRLARVATPTAVDS